MARTRSRNGASGFTGAESVERVAARRSAVRCSTAAQNPSVSPNWYCTAPQVAPISLAMRLADTEPGSPEASDFSAASSMLSRVAWPRRLGRLSATFVLATFVLATFVFATTFVRVTRQAYHFHRGYCDSVATRPIIFTRGGTARR